MLEACALRASQEFNSTQLEEARPSRESHPHPFPHILSIPFCSVHCTHFDYPRLCRLPTQAEGRGCKAVLWELQLLFAAEICFGAGGAAMESHLLMSAMVLTIIIRLQWLSGGGRGEGETHQMLVVGKCPGKRCISRRARAHRGGFCLALFCSKLALPSQSQCSSGHPVATERRESQCSINLFLFLLACDSFLKVVFIDLKSIGV